MRAVAADSLASVGEPAARLVAAIRRLAVAPSLPEMMEIVTQAVRAMLKADGATFVLRDGDLCYYADEEAVSPLWEGRRFPMNACISGWCMLNDQAVAIPDIYVDERIPHDAYRPTFVHSLAMAPVRRTEPFAAIGAYWDRPRPISDAELEWLQTIADASALAISVAQLTPLAEARQAAAEAEARYRAVFNQAAAGVARVAPDGRFLEVNERFTQIAGFTRAELLQFDFARITHPEDLASDVAQAQALLDGERETYAMEKRYLRKDGSVVWVLLTVSLVRKPDGAPDYFIAVAEDISERKAAEVADRARAEEFQALADYIPALCWMAYADGEVYWYNQRWYDYTGSNPESQLGSGWESVHDPELLPEVRARWRRSVETGELFEMTFPLRRRDGSYRPFLTRVVPIRGKDGRISRWFGTSTDVADQQAHQEHLKLLINELNHRVKNTLATVQSMAAQTLRSATNADVAFEQLEGRLLSLSMAHNILTERSWEGAALREVAERTLRPYVADIWDRVRLVGPQVWLRPQAAVAISLALNELATNAVKFGALVGVEGRVDLTWTFEGPGGGDLAIRWAESGGPAVAPPTRSGFGSRLIERSLPREFGGDATLRFEPGGVVCTMRLADPERWRAEAIEA
jgi:PAS domain S-box-containing protein